MIYINQNFSQFLALSLVGASYTEFRVGTSTPTAIVVDWGDGFTTSYSGSYMTISHTYSSPFTDRMKISCSSGNNLITSIDQFSESNTNNSIAFTTTQIGYFINLNTFSCTHSNVVTGDIANLPNTLTIIEISGNNTTTGDIANLPINLNVYINEGNNTTTGDIANLPSSLVQYINTGNNTTFGNISSLPSSLGYYNNSGNNTTTGDIANLPSSLGYYINEGNNTTFGNISSLPSTLLAYINTGNNTTTGDIANLPSSLSYYYNTGLNTVIEYTAGRVWSTPMKSFVSLPMSSGLSSIEVDNLLIELSIPTWTAYSPVTTIEVDISGNNLGRTPTSDAAVALLISKGVTVITN